MNSLNRKSNEGIKYINKLLFLNDFVSGFLDISIGVDSSFGFVWDDFCGFEVWLEGVGVYVVITYFCFVGLMLLNRFV